MQTQHPVVSCPWLRQQGMLVVGAIFSYFFPEHQFLCETVTQADNKWHVEIERLKQAGTPSHLYDSSDSCLVQEMWLHPRWKALRIVE